MQNRPRRATSHEIARLAGVSQATVSNVLNHPEIVSAATRARVESAMESLDFVVNTAARSLREGHARVLGVIVPDVSNGFWGEFTRAVEETAAMHGHSVLFASSFESAASEERYLRTFESQQVAGILVAPVGRDLTAARATRRRGTPLVLVDRPPSDEIGLPAVGVDHVVGAGLAADHVFERGHRHIAAVNGPHSVPWCGARWTGWQRSAALHGGTVTEITVADLTVRSGVAAADGVVALVPRVTAVVCANDLLALGVLRGLDRRGYSVPDDLSLVGYDDADFAEALSPPLTTVRQDPRALGTRAANRLIKPETAKVDSLHVQLVPRESVAPPR